MNAIEETGESKGSRRRTVNPRLTRLSQEFAGRLGVLLGLFLLSVTFSLLSPIFLTWGNLSAILVQAGTNALVAAGMSFVILTGQIDLSVGSVLALSSVVGTTVMLTGNVLLGIAVALLVGTGLGLANGFFVSMMGLPSFIVTLATMWLARGLAYVFTNGQAVTGLPPSFQVLATGNIAGIPIIVWLVALVYLVAYYVLAHSTFGRKVYAVGDNEESARLSGINVKSVKLRVFAISGFVAALGGVVLASRLFSGQPVAGISFELSAIAAVVIGGTSLYGGKGSVIGTLVGAIFISTLLNGLVILNVIAFWQQVIMGIVVLAAVIIDKYRQQLAVQ
jgi:ribose transport system permease protein